MTTTQIIMVVAVVAVIALLVSRFGQRTFTRVDPKAQREKEMQDRDDA